MDYDEDDGSLSVVDDDVDGEGYKVECPNLKEWYDRNHLRRSLVPCPSYYYCYRRVDPSSEPDGNVPRPQPFPVASLTFGQI